jgi:hypothetical protein
VFDEWDTCVTYGECALGIQARNAEARAPSGHWDAVLAQAAISGLFAVLRARHDADRSVGKVAAFLALPQ